MSDFSIVLVGHSFIRRFRDYHLPYHAGGHDILQPNAVRAAQLSDALNLEHHVEGVHTYADNVVMADDLTHSIPLIRAVRPNIVLMDIGSNDLANLHMTDHFSSLDLATRVFDIAKQYNEQRSVPMVIINSILPRSNNIACMADVFLRNAEHYNNVVSNYCDKKKIIYNKQRGFHFMEIQGQQVSHPVSSWSKDGIHCDIPQSMAQYTQRLRRAILDNSSYLYL